MVDSTTGSMVGGRIGGRVNSTVGGTIGSMVGNRVTGTVDSTVGNTVGTKKRIAPRHCCVRGDSMKYTWRIAKTIDNVTVKSLYHSIDPTDAVQMAATDVEQDLLRNDDHGDPIPHRITIEIERSK